MGIFDPEIHNDRDRTLRCSLFKALDRENWCEKRAGLEERESATPFSWLRASPFSLLFFFLPPPYYPKAWHRLAHIYCNRTVKCKREKKRSCITWVEGGGWRQRTDFSLEPEKWKPYPYQPPTRAFLGELVLRDEKRAPLKTPAWEAISVPEKVPV